MKEENTIGYNVTVANEGSIALQMKEENTIGYNVTVAISGDVSSFFFFLLLICAYNVWIISPPFSPPPPLPPHPFPLPPTPSLPGRNCSALISNFVEETI
jgi:hypothetical protein